MRNVEPPRPIAVIPPEAPVHRGPDRTAASLNVRPVEEGQFSYSPPNDPIRDSDFTGVGRPGLVKRPMAIFQNIAHILAGDQPSFAFGPPTFNQRSNNPHVNRGLQTPLVERINVDRPANIPYGNLARLTLPPYFGYIPPPGQ